MASPHVVGTAALIISSGVTDASQVRGILRTAADDLDPVGPDHSHGYGLVDAEEVVTGTQTSP